MSAICNQVNVIGLYKNTEASISLHRNCPVGGPLLPQAKLYGDSDG